MSANPAPRRTPRLPAWKLEDAKAKFSQVVRDARANGPQLVTLRGEDAVVVLSAEDYDRLSPPSPERSLWDVFANSPFARLDGFEDVIQPTLHAFRDLPDFSEDG